MWLNDGADDDDNGPSPRQFLYLPVNTLATTMTRLMMMMTTMLRIPTLPYDAKEGQMIIWLFCFKLSLTEDYNDDDNDDDGDDDNDNDDKISNPSLWCERGSSDDYSIGSFSLSLTDDYNDDCWWGGGRGKWLRWWWWKYFHFYDVGDDDKISNPSLWSERGSSGLCSWKQGWLGFWLW